MNRRSRVEIIGIKVDVISWEKSIEKILYWSNCRKGKRIYLVNVHSLVTARTNKTFKNIIHKSSLSLPDGAPIVWFSNLIGFKQKRRIAGPDLMEELIRQCESRNLSIYFFGSTPENINILNSKLESDFPKLIFKTESPPFRKQTTNEKFLTLKKINSFNANIVFVGLGCPKQEIWINEASKSINAPILGVGAAFDFYTGNVRRAPFLLRKYGLEWLFRLLMDPERLFLRYLKTNSIFLFLAIKQLINKFYLEKNKNN